MSKPISFVTHSPMPWTPLRANKRFRLCTDINVMETSLFYTMSERRKGNQMEDEEPHTSRIAPPHPPPKMRPQLPCFVLAEVSHASHTPTAHSLLLVVATCLGSSLALDLRSSTARMCCRNVVTSTSKGDNVGGDTSFRLPLRSRGRTIFDTGGQHRSVGQNTTAET